MTQKIILEKEAVAILGVPISTVYEWVKEESLCPLNEVNPYQFDLAAIYDLMEKDYRFNLKAYPFLKQIHEDGATLKKPRKKGAFNRPKRNYEELFAAVSNNQPLKKLNIDWSKYDSRFMSSTIHIDALGGGIWAREFCFGALRGDGVDDLIDIVIPDKLVVKELFPCDYGGDHSVVITGKTQWVNFAINFFNKK